MRMTLAFVFPGQGSQSVGMLSALAATCSIVQETFAQASAVLDYDLWTLVADGPEARLNETQVTQPAMLAAGVATWRAWLARGGPAPSVMAGHSLGEYTALCCAGTFDFPTAVKLVANRARFMQEAVPIGQGAMAAILGLDDDAVRTVCERSAQGDVLAPVNFNSPGQVVIAGTAGAVARAVEDARVAGAKRALLLPVSVPSHCALMHPAAERMAALLAETPMHVPRVPVVHNAHVRAESSVAGIRAALASQIESPVRWAETVAQIARDGARIAIECGPGRVLAGLNKRIAKELNTLPVYDPPTLDAALAAAGMAKQEGG